jgi:hypothetical protein
MQFTEDNIQKIVDQYITRFRTTPIQYLAYVAGAVDRYRQRDKTFAAPSPDLIGRAIHKPTPEKVTVIGQGEVYEIAFLFSRLEMLRKFPSATEGEWIQPEGRMTWRSRTYKIEKVKPSGQTGETFSLVIVLANSILGNRDL